MNFRRATFHTLLLLACPLAAQNPFGDGPAARLPPFIAQWQDASPHVRSRARGGLRRGNSAAVQALIAVLADENRAAQHAAVQDALVALRASSIDPLTASLVSESPALKVHVA